jgi:uncharacterized membrane protein YidH (DUF202 family)
MADPDQRVPGIGDGLRRAQLAAERTYLAWWRTALATVAVAIAIGRVLPDVLNAGTTWPYVVVGAGWGVLAIAIAAYAPFRQRRLRSAIDEGAYAHPHQWALGLLSAGGIILMVASVALIIISP